jgi:DNA-binding FadR family transcriptional regulator
MVRASAASVELGEPKLAQRLADQLESDLRLKALPKGQLIGTIGDLSEHFGVGRKSLRQAVLLLESQGVLELRRGIGGGVMVGASGVEAAAMSLATYLEFFTLSARELLGARAVIDGLAAKLAAERASLEQANNLRQRLLRPRAEELAEALMLIEQTSIIARLSNNPILNVFSDVLRQASVENLAGPPQRYAAISQAAASYRSNMSEAILAGDADQALVLAHNWYGRDLPDLMEPIDAETITGQSSLGRAAVEFEANVRWVLFGQRSKTAEILVRLILREVRLRGLSAGDRLGSEGDILERYGVDRSVLREAARMLERHGMMKAKVGKSGGLYIGAADPQAAVASFANHMRGVVIAPGQFREVRLRLEPEMARQSAGKGVTDAGMETLETPAGTVLPLLVQALWALDPEGAGSGPSLHKSSNPSLAYREVVEAIRAASVS